MIKNVFFALLLGILGCTGQKPAGLKSEVRSIRNELKASCASVDFHQEPFSKKSIQSLFECAKWNKEYPDLFQSLKMIPKKSWDHLGLSLSKSFYADKAKMKKFNKFITYLKANQGFTEYEELIKSLIQDGQSFEILSKILTQPEKVELIREGLPVLEINSNELKKQILVLNHVLGVLAPHQKNLATFLKSKQSPEFDELKINLFNKLADSILKIKTKEETQIIQNFVFSESQNQSVFKKWVIGGNAFERFKGFYILATDNYSQVQQDLNLILNMNENQIVCKSLNPDVPFVIYPRVEMDSKLNLIKVASHEDFIASLVDGVSKNLSFANFCAEGGDREDVQEYINSNYRFLDKLLAFTLDQRNFEFLQETQEAVEVNQSNKWWILDFIRGDLFASLSAILNDSLNYENPDILLKVYFDVVKSLDHKEYKGFSDFIKTVLEKNDKKSIDSLAKLWLNLDPELKVNIIRVLELLVESNIDLSKIKEINSYFLELYPSFIKELQDHLLFDKKAKTIDSLKSVSDSFSDSKVQKDIVRFLSSKNLFKMLDLLAKDDPTLKEKPVTKNPVEQSLTENSDFVQIKPWVDCFNQIRDLSKQLDYYQVVNQLPEVCQKRISKTGLAGSIFEWMEASNKLFLDYAGYEIHQAKGVWSSEMLHLLFGYATLVGHNYKDVYQSEDYTLIYTELADLINRQDQRKKINSTFDLVSKLLLDMNGFDQWASDIALMEESKLRDNFKILLSNDELDKRPGKIEAKTYNCNDLVGIPNDLKCIKKEDIQSALINIDKILLKKNNEADYTLLEGAVNFLHPSLGIQLPFQEDGQTHTTKLSDLMRFVYDLGHESTSKPYFYYTQLSSEKLNASTLSRVETVIREIGFSNNFYGSYFMNLAADAYDYQKKIYSMKSLLTIMEGSSGLLRGFGVLPKESKWKLKNVKQAYLSLAEVADSYETLGLSSRSHGNLVQALLKVISQSSSIESQHFNAFKKPNVRVVENHNGRFLTELSKISALTRLSTYLQLKIKGNEKAVFESKELRFLDEYLFKNTDPKELTRLLSKVLALKNEKGEPLWIDGVMNLIDSVEKASLKEIALMEEIAIESLMLFSDPRLKLETTSSLVRLVEKFLPFHQKFSNVVKVDMNEKSLTSLLQNLRTIRSNSNKLDTIFGLVNYLAPWLEKILVSEADVDLIVELTKIYDQETVDEPSKDILSSFKLALQDDRFSLTPVINTLRVMHEENRSYELRDIIRILREKKSGRFYLDIALDELFIHSQDSVTSFLKDTFPALTLPRN
jgi:hypothetical protein